MVNLMRIQGPQAVGGLDFSPISQALDFGQKARTQNAMLANQEAASRRADEQLKIQQGRFGLEQQNAATRQQLLTDPLAQEKRRLEVESIRANIARANTLADPAAKLKARMQIAGQLGLKPGTPEYQSFVIAGGTTQGKTFQTFMGPDGKYYAAQPVDNGPPRIYPLNAPGQPAMPGGAAPQGVPSNPGVPGATVAPASPAPAEAPGQSPLTPAKTKTVDTGTEILTLDPAGRILSRVPKAVAETERQKAVGKAAGTDQVNLPKAVAAYQAQVDQSGSVATDIDRALGQISPNTTSWRGALFRQVPGTPAYDLSQTLNTIKANIGFDKLQAMRDASPTGGALGQVSEQENRLLQSVWGSVEQSQSPKQLISNLRRFKTQYAKSMARIRNMFRMKYGVTPEQSAAGTAPTGAPAEPQAPAAPGIPQPGTVMDGFRFRGGNPADPNSWERAQ